MTRNREYRLARTSVAQHTERAQGNRRYSGYANKVIWVSEQVFFVLILDKIKNKNVSIKITNRAHFFSPNLQIFNLIEIFFFV
jgi:hypothetical protein